MNRTKRNIIIFTVFSAVCGWIGYLVDKLTDQAHYENMEDAVINPLLLLGIVSIEKNQAFLFSLSVGLIPTLLYLTAGLSIRKWRKKRLLQ